jgi:hypothetical protein
VRNASCFWLHAHNLKVETCHWKNWHHDQGPCICDNCDSRDIQDEKHLLFYCSCNQVCGLCRKYEKLFNDVYTSLLWFFETHAFLPFLSYNLHKDAVSNEDVFRFLSQGTIHLYKFISELLFYDS